MKIKKTYDNLNLPDDTKKKRIEYNKKTLFSKIKNLFLKGKTK